MYVISLSLNSSDAKKGPENFYLMEFFEKLTDMTSGMVTMKVKVAQSCPTLCDPKDYTVHGILQAGILEWAALPFSRGSSQFRKGTQVTL